MEPGLDGQLVESVCCSEGQVVREVRVAWLGMSGEGVEDMVRWRLSIFVENEAHSVVVAVINPVDPLGPSYCWDVIRVPH